MKCPVCRATSDDAHKLDCPHRAGKGLTVPADFDGEVYEMRLGESARLQCDAPPITLEDVAAAVRALYVCEGCGSIPERAHVRIRELEARVAVLEAELARR